ncbi:Uncharacterised protein [Vibrio cholerae]|nr:Uncharacterised protein [Vibrio cholerae]CSC81011.1 Uncharacterised protein [Vibrio cholerae]
MSSGKRRRSSHQQIDRSDPVSLRSSLHGYFQYGHAAPSDLFSMDLQPKYAVQYPASGVNNA